MKTIKKRYFVFAWLAVELASIPAAAQIIDRVIFSAPQTVASAILPSQDPGITKIAVTSNAPFAIIAKNSIGDMDISVHTRGDINGTRFGDNAQMPGDAIACSALSLPLGQKIYEADRKTALKPGNILSQSVIVEIRHDADLSPEFSVLTQKDAAGISLASPCSITAA